MPLAPIPHREPTTAELASYIKDCEARLRDDMKHRSLIVRLWAECFWKVAVSRQDPNAFIVPFATSVTNYDDYLRSPGWRDIRRRKLEAVGRRCECGCGREATEVHHRDYRPRVLSGQDLSPLVALCRRCHHTVEYDDIGRKRDVWQDKERVVAELMAGRGRLAPGRNRGWFQLKIADGSYQRRSSGVGTESSPKALPPMGSTSPAADEHLRERRRRYQREYRRRKEIRASMEYAERRSKMKAYDLGREDAVAHRSAIETHNARPPSRCPFARGTPEEAEYDRGWNDVMRR